jgi:hypothetical protein
VKRREEKRREEKRREEKKTDPQAEITRSTSTSQKTDSD